MIAIVGAMHAELRALLTLMQRRRIVVRAGREFHVGEVELDTGAAPLPMVMVLSGIGKVAAATTATLLMGEFGVSRIVFSGVAGGLGAAVRIGDVVVARTLLQHDLDASPLFPRYEVPLTGVSRFAVDAPLADALAAAARRCLDDAVSAPRVHEGLVVSGDRFVSTAAESRALVAALPDALAVEMEGAALAQVCADFGVPFAVVRTISDRADDSAHVDFERFIAEVASRYALAIVADWLAHDAAASASASAATSTAPASPSPRATPAADPAA